MVPPEKDQQALGHTSDGDHRSDLVAVRTDQTDIATSGMIHLLVFLLGEQRYALRLSAVEKIVLMVEITPLPKAPEVVLGVINLQGRIIPVIDIRRRFRLPKKETALYDHLVIARTSRRAVALVVDAAADVTSCVEQDVVAADAVVPNMEYVEGVAKLDDGIVLIHDLDKFLALEEEETLTNALSQGNET